MLKPFILVVGISFLTLGLSAQTIPNGGFEDWRLYPNSIYETPQGWTDNDLLYQRFDPGYRGITVLKTTQSHSGKYALQLGVSFDHNDTVNGGIYSIGTVDSLIKGVLSRTAISGFPCTQRYESFTGYYVFNSLPGDTAVFGVFFTKWNWVKRKRDTLVNTVLRIGDAHPDYVPFVVPLKYKSKNEVPDTAYIYIGIQSKPRSAAVGTVLVIDDLQFSGRVEQGEEEKHK